jgi:uncharacterized repeat protein (TIGR01451 family)
VKRLFPIIALVAMLAAVVAVPATAAPAPQAIRPYNGRQVTTFTHPSNPNWSITVTADLHLGLVNGVPVSFRASGRATKGNGALRVQLDRHRLGRNSSTWEDCRISTVWVKSNNGFGPPCLPLNSGNSLTSVAGHSDWISTTGGDRLAIRVFVSVRWADQTLSQFSLRTQSITVGEPRLTTLTVDKTHHDPDPPVTAPDDDFTYRIEVHNTGAYSASAVLISDAWPPGLDEPATLPAGCRFQLVSGGPNRVICQVAVSLLPDDSAVVVLNARTNATASGTLTNTVFAIADNAPEVSDTDQVVIGG